MSNQTRVPASNTLFQAPSNAPEHLSASDKFAAEDDTSRFAESLADLNSSETLSNPFAQAMANIADAESSDGSYSEGVNEVPASPEELTDLQKMFDGQDGTLSSDEQQDPTKLEELEKARARAEAVQRVANEEELFSARQQQEERQTAMALEQTRAQLVQILVSKGLTDTPTYTQIGLANIVDDQGTGIGQQNTMEKAISGAQKAVEFVGSDPNSGETWNVAKQNMHIKSKEVWDDQTRIDRTANAGA